MRSTFCGTLEYVSPEMIENKKYNNSVDVWSLGVLTYELIFGRSPFSGKDYEDTFKNVLKVTFFLFFFVYLKHKYREILALILRFRSSVENLLIGCLYRIRYKG